MDDIITITVTGPRASGKTTTAARLVALLRAIGHEATYCGRTHEQEEAVERIIRARVVGSLPLKFHVRDEE